MEGHGAAMTSEKVKVLAWEPEQGSLSLLREAECPGIGQAGVVLVGVAVSQGPPPKQEDRTPASH